MKEDLRYLERLMKQDEIPNEHPSSEELKSFKQGRQIGKVREKMLAHLVRCRQCSETVATQEPTNVTKVKLSKYINKEAMNIFFATAASVMFVLFFSFQGNDARLGDVDMASVWVESGYKAPVPSIHKENKIDADAYLKKIIQTTNMTNVEYFTQALLLDKEEKYTKARAMYKQAFIAIRHNVNVKERMKQKIVINYKLLELGLNEKKETDDSVEEYKEILRYDIAIYVLEYLGK